MTQVMLQGGVTVRPTDGLAHEVAGVLDAVADQAVADGNRQEGGEEPEGEQERHRRRPVLLHDGAAEGQGFVSQLAPNFSQRQKHQPEGDGPDEGDHQPGPGCREDVHPVRKVDPDEPVDGHLGQCYNALFLRQWLFHAGRLWPCLQVLYLAQTGYHFWANLILASKAGTYSSGVGSHVAHKYYTWLKCVTLSGLV
jgi:hypothetical protein